MRGDRYQVALIALGVVVTALFWVFFVRELYPEYKIYQNRYHDLEEFRASYTGEPMAPFKFGIKQLVIEHEDLGPATIDRCTSCHVALKFEHFSPTRLVKDGTGELVQEENPDYVWGRLTQKIEQLRIDGETAEADRLESWKTASVGEHTYDMTRVLQMHPLMGKETRPFEFHPIEEYGCVSCHNGNGRGLTTSRAHGPVYDGDYEEEFMGPKPIFTEPDSKNDPKFSNVFNGKPSHAMLFQTTPLFVGSLIQAQCMQCHQPDTESAQEQSEVGALTKDFHEGEQLYVSQACYACHRIAGSFRGGVGPDLTNIGNYYPWFIKESIVWPQADLKTSTMPNYKLDHEELEDLVTYLLAQKGRPMKASEVGYKAELMAWEAGEKEPIERPIPPAKVRDLRYGMTLFATEGCASCHRLKGFESNVGFTVEKGEPTFDQLDRERKWFQKLIPEEVIGSQIVLAIEAHGDEIDKRIVAGVREDSLLEELEKKFPGTLESYNAGFKYAMRAKNHLMMSPEERSEWEGRIRRLMMIYIQEYGLGRVVGPRPNWSGIYRTNEWLMGHFWKPSAYSARSIMPVFPFDNTKFYALTYMLNVLAQKNRDAVHQIWKERGFDPELAAQIFCSQCHGEYLQGNGPVSEWIYPIPKNLRNANFLRTLTKTNVIESLIHGIKGGPMPPWGEVATDKPMADGIPVMSKDEIRQLADWLFSSLAGEGIIREDEDVPKWQYDPGDVIEELKKEGNRLQPKLPHHSALLAARDGAVPPKKVKRSDIFDLVDDKVYIQDRYFTEANFKAGQDYFEINCAVCHGKELDGAGFRAGTMFDAKPRMLSNLKWLRTRDDLRLLRSIKYGVSGTSMTPWGDQTSSLQRLQLVIYIRMVSEEQNLREDMFKAFYQTYDAQLGAIQEARFVDSTRETALEKELESVLEAHKALYEQVRAGFEPADTALPLYQKQLKLEDQIERYRERDAALVKIKEGILHERELLQNFGVFLIHQKEERPIYNNFLKMISFNVAQYRYDQGKLMLTFDPDKEKQQKRFARKLLIAFDSEIAELKQEKVAVTGKIPSAQKEQELVDLDQEIASIEKLRRSLSSALDEISHLRTQQQTLISSLSPKGRSPDI